MKNRLLQFCLVLFALFILMPSEKRGILVVIFGLVAVMAAPQKPDIKQLKAFIINASPFLVYLISAIWYFDAQQTPKKLETGLSILVLPFIFAIVNKNSLFSQKTKTLFFKLFLLSSAIFSLIIISYFAHLGYFNGTRTYGYCLAQVTNNLPIWSDHPIYISIILCLSVIFSYQLYITGLKRRDKILLVALILIIIATVLFLSRRGPILALIISFIPLLNNLFKRTEKKKLILRIVAIVLILSGCIIVFVKPINKRILEVVNVKTYLGKNETNSVNNRVQIYKCAIELIENKPIFGYGIGRDKKELYDCYKENLYYLYENKFNTHNQYFSILLRSGIIGFIIFLCFMCYNYNIAIRSGDLIFLSILLFYTVIFLFENVLERQNGVIFFAFIINYFAFRGLNYKEEL
jgi:O-antigen ligase